MTQKGNGRGRVAWRWTGIGCFLAGLVSLGATAAFWIDFWNDYRFHPYRVLHGLTLYPREWADYFLYVGLALVLAGCVAFVLMRRFPVQKREASLSEYVPPREEAQPYSEDADQEEDRSARRTLEQFIESAGFAGVEEPSEEITQVICIHCRKEYDWDYPKCPHCGAVNDVLLRKRRD